MCREATCKVIDLAEDGALSWEAIARECLARMSEDEVADMGHELGWLVESAWCFVVLGGCM